MRTSDKILIGLSIAFVCVYVGVPQIKNQTTSDVCKIFDESGYPPIEREARGAEGAVRASMHEKRDVVFGKFVEALDAAMAVSGVTVLLYRLDAVKQNAAIQLWLRVPNCDIQFLSMIRDTQGMRNATALPPTTKATIYGKVIEDYLRPYVLRVAISRIVLPDGTVINAEPAAADSKGGQSDALHAKSDANPFDH